MFSLPRVQVQSLVGELRSHKKEKKKERNPAAIQDTAALPTPAPHPSGPVLHPFTLVTHSLICSLLSFHMPEFRPITSHHCSLPTVVRATPTACPLASRPQPCPSNPSSRHQKSDHTIPNLTPCSGPHRPPDKFQLLAQYTCAAGPGPACGPLFFSCHPQRAQQTPTTPKHPPVSCLCIFFFALVVPFAWNALSEPPTVGWR